MNPDERRQLLRDAIDARKREIQGLAPRNQTDPRCRGLTQKSERCPWGARASGYCHWHEQQLAAA